MYTTIEQVKYDENFLCGLELANEYGLSVYLLYRGGSKVGYHAFEESGKVLFYGNDFKPSPLHSIDDIQSCTSLLSFLTVQPGDTDPEYFKDYTPEQMNWAKSFKCEVFKGLLSDYENSSEPEYQSQAKVIIESKFVR